MGKVYEHAKAFDRKFPGSLCWRLKSHAKVVESYLDSDEEVLLAFGAQKNESFFEIFNSYAFCLTNKRIILGKKRILWGSFMYSITPDLYNDMEIYRGLIWGKVTIDTVKEKIILTNVAKSSLDEIETIISNFMMEAKQKYKIEDK